jgi:UDP-2,4-diacetamido-2,4,6-trideoxy-beta-L-altropyranose hydrolase
MTKLPRLVLRADGNARIGLGHVMRLVALADILRGAFAECVFATRDATTLGTLLAENGLRPEPVPELPPSAEAAWLREHLLRATDVLVLDGYLFDFDYQQMVRAGVGRLVYVDDLHAWPVVADVVINHSPGIGAEMYELARPATLLLGTAYSLLRPEFLAAAAAPRPAGPIGSVLVCFGGADPFHLTARCLPLLLSLPELTEIGVLLGPASTDRPALQRQLAAQPPGRATLHHPTDAAGLVQLLHQYDAVICPASTLLVEALVLGSRVVTGYYVDNQNQLANFVHAHQQAYSVGNFTTLTDEALLRSLRDGLGFLARHSRQPYASGLRPEVLRDTIAALPSAIS